VTPSKSEESRVEEKTIAINLFLKNLFNTFSALRGKLQHLLTTQNGNTEVAQQINAIVGSGKKFEHVPLEAESPMFDVLTWVDGSLPQVVDCQDSITKMKALVDKVGGGIPEPRSSKYEKLDHVIVKKETIAEINKKFFSA